LAKEATRRPTSGMSVSRMCCPSDGFGEGSRGLRGRMRPSAPIR
jgi:hypothetical protein